MDPCLNIADRLSEQIALRPHQRAIVFPGGRDGQGRRLYSQLTFKQTGERVNSFARGFSRAGILPGDRVSLFVRPSLDFMPLVFALYKIGAVVVLIDPGMGRKGLLSCVERIAPKALVAVPEALAASRLYSGKFRSVRIRICVGPAPWLWGATGIDSIAGSDASPMESHSPGPGEEASILFTSGSTGPAKGVRYTHGILDAQTRHIQQMYGIEAGEIDLPCFPLFGLFSLAMGMTVVVPDMDPTKPALADPALLSEAILDQGVTNAFASPALWKPFAAWCIREGATFPSLRRILSAGAPIPPSLHKGFKEILSPGAQIHTPYGATESLPVASIASDEVLQQTSGLTEKGAGTCVGRLAPGIDARIIRISDEPIGEWAESLCIAQGDIGEICVRGEVVTTEYKEEPEHTRIAKIYGPGDTVWHRMGDVGYFDADGRLWFCGRKSHRVVLADGKTLFPVQCEAIFNQHPQVSRTALVGVDGAPVLLVERAPGSGPSDPLARELLDLARASPLTDAIGRILYHPSFPVDVRHNAKIHRLQLRDWAKGQL
jgi:olefin beta-lactone synthetase